MLVTARSAACKAKLLLMAVKHRMACQDFGQLTGEMAAADELGHLHC